MIDKKIKRNLFANGLQQILTYCLPFITVPYLTRVIGPEGIGAYSYTNSIVQYFILFGSFGLTLYGTRQIAYCRDDFEERSKEFCRIVILRLLLSAVSVAAYGVFICAISSEYKIYLAIQGLALLASAFDISWYFQGTEDFSVIVRKAVAFKLVGTCCIFLFVKGIQDVWIYILIQTSVILLGNLAVWPSLKDNVHFCRVSVGSILKHLKPTVLLFLPQIAIELYAVFDKTMIGMLADMTQVGLYTKAEEFAKMPLMLIGIISNVLFPRMSNEFRKKGISSLNTMLNVNLQIASLIGIGASFGVAAIAADFVPWMMGSDFSGCIVLMYILCPLAWIIGSSNTLGRQYMIPSDNTRQFTISVIVGACVNFSLNLVLIPNFGAIGACVATVIAESAVTLFQFICIHKAVEKKEYIAETLKCLIAGLTMFLVVRFVGTIVRIKVINTIVQVAVGVTVYFLMLILLRCKLYVCYVQNRKE